MWISRSNFSQDVARWRDQGWVTPEGAAAIAAEIAARRRGPGLAGALGILGAILLGFAMMSFVAANWQDMSRLARLVVIFVGMLASYGAAAVLFSRGMDAFAHAAILLAVAIFGAGIMLISQMYHIDGRPPEAVLVWALGAFGAGVLLRSTPALAASALLFALWSGWESILAERAHLPFLLPVAALSAAFVVERWRPGLHIVASLMSGWLIWFGYVEGRGQAHWLVAVFGLVVAFAMLAVIDKAPRASLLGTPAETIASPLLGYASAVAYGGLFAMQFVNTIALGPLVMIAALSLALLLGLVVYGLRTGQRHLVWLGYSGFSVEILGVYFKTVGTLLGSSVFFFTAGFVVIGLAGLAWRLHRAEERRVETSV
ncbi:MAG: DUF2157 domain-containing protein [Hyphomicrobiaceae bacterium]